METLRLNAPDEAVEILKNGGLVAVPTETVYGLCCNALDAAAVAKVFEVKGRPEVKALSVMVIGVSAFERFCLDVPPQAYTLAKKFWPGPLTIVLKAKDCFPDSVLAGGDTVGLRCPNHAVTLEILKQADLPLAAPSANPSGLAGPTDATLVLEYFDGKIDAVIDGGVCAKGRESTIVDISGAPYKILREAAVPADEVWDCLARALTIVGVTGGSGSGKSVVSDALVARGATFIDCDAVYHELTVSCEEMRSETIAAFGDVYDGNVLNRKKLGAIVFADKNALLKLNEITHKYVHREVLRRVRECAEGGKALVAIEAIELIGSPSSGLCKFIVGVTAPHDARIKRLMARENISEEYARSRLSAQRGDDYFEGHCDYVLTNDGDIDAFKKKCENFFAEVLKYGEENR